MKEPGLGRPEGNPESVCHLIERKTQIKAKDEDCALLERQPPEGSFDGIALDDGVVTDRLELGVPWQHPNLCMHASRTPGLGIALARENAVKPRLEPIGVSKRTEVAPGQDECRLNGVISAVGVAQDPERDCHALIANQPGKSIEGLTVPLLGTVDERCVHPTLPQSPPDLSGSHYRGGRVAIGSIWPKKEEGTIWALL